MKRKAEDAAVPATTLRRYYSDGSGEYVGNLVRRNDDGKYVVDMFHPEDPKRVYRETWNATEYRRAQELH